MNTSYVPQPGTIPARVIAHLKTLPAGTMVPDAVLAETLDVLPDLKAVLHVAHLHGAVVRELRDGRPWWGVEVHPQLRVLAGPPAVSADDDDFDDAPFVRRHIPSTAWSPPKETAMPTPAPTPPQPKKARVAAPAFDPLAIELKKDRALPPKVRSGASPYKTLLERMEQGDSVDLPTVAAKSMVSAAKKLGIKVAVRAISAEVSGVWRL